MASYSQKKVTRSMGLHDVNMLSRWERGITSPNIGQVLLIARLYNTQPHLLYPELWHSAASDLLAHQEPIVNQ